MGILMNRYLLEAPKCPKCGKSNSFEEERPYQVMRVAKEEHRDEDGERIVDEWKWRCDCGYEWVDEEANEEYEEAMEDYERDVRKLKFLRKWKENRDMRYRRNKERLGELEGMSLGELKEEFGDRFGWIMMGMR